MRLLQKIFLFCLALMLSFAHQSTQAGTAGTNSDHLCGFRCISGVLARQGIPINSNALRKSLIVSKQGVSMWDLEQAAKHFDLKTQAMRLSWSQLIKQTGPVILY